MMFSGITLLFCVSSLLSFTVTATAQSNGDLRLARGSISLSSYSSGRLEIYINGLWGTVCNDFFTITDANVACRQLGYSGASSTITASSNSSFGSGSGTIWLDDVGCSGSESCLLSCSNRGIGVHNCFHSADVAVFCSGTRFSSTDCSNVPSQRNGDLRLARGSISLSSYSSGRLEIYINGLWGTVCNDFFTITDANAACRQLGYSGASSTITASSNSSFGSGSGTIWLDDVGCSGSESCLLSCPNRGIGVHNCFHSEDVAIFCSGTRFSRIDCSFINTAQSYGDLRLAQGSLTSSSYSSGRLEIFINGQWGTVCDDSFGFTDAGVACRQLGYSGASRSPITARDNSLFGSGSGQIWLDDVGCTGSESCLISCSNRGIGVDNCFHFEDVAIFCSGSRTLGATNCSSAPTSRPSNTVSGGTSVANNLLGIIVGATIGAIVLFVVIPIVICVVCFCCVAGGVGAAASSSRRSRTVTTTTSTPAATTATVVTTSSQQAAYPQSYPAAGTDYKQAPPPAYTTQPTEMSTYPPQPQAAYPAPYPAQHQDPYPPKEAYPPQGGYPPQGDYPPQAGYPPQGGYPPQAGYPPQ